MPTIRESGSAHSRNLNRQAERPWRQEHGHQADDEPIRWFGGGTAVVYGGGMLFVYHLCPVDMHGHTLLSLNGLKAERPDLYDRERPKWDGRESVLTWRVPHLGVPWADTDNLSALDPRLLAAERR